MTCVLCGAVDGHWLYCNSPTDDGTCVIPWCHQVWSHMAPCDDRIVRTPQDAGTP